MKYHACLVNICTATISTIGIASLALARPAVIITQEQDGYVNVREQPSAQSEQLHCANNGTTVSILSSVQGADGYTWYDVSLNSNKVGGYIRGDFLRFVSSLDEGKPWKEGCGIQTAGVTTLPSDAEITAILKRGEEWSPSSRQNCTEYKTLFREDGTYSAVKKYPNGTWGIAGNPHYIKFTIKNARLTTFDHRRRTSVVSEITAASEDKVDIVGITAKGVSYSLFNCS